jgi:hypothetical protein
MLFGIQKVRECIRGLSIADNADRAICAGFINAQYRFVMRPTGDYTVHFADPDM